MTALPGYLAVGGVLLAATLAGIAFLRFVDPGRRLSLPEEIAGGFALGLLLEALLCLAVLPWPGRPAAGTFAAANAVLLAASAWGLTRPRPTGPPGRRASPGGASGGAFAGALLCVAALGCLRLLLEAIGEPMWATDFLAIWGLKGRSLFATGEIPARLFHDSAIAWAHPEYPLLLPLLFAALSGALGAWNDQALAILYPMCQVATVLCLFGFLRRRVSTLAGAGAAAVIAWSAGLYASSNLGTGEIPLALGLALLSTAFLDFLEEDTSGARVRLALFALLCASLKQEGALFALLLAGVLLLRAALLRSQASLRAALFVALPPVAHAVALRMLSGPIVRRDFDLGLLAPARGPELGARFVEVGKRILSVELVSAAPAIFAIALIFVFTRKNLADVLLIPVSVSVLFYAGICAFSAFDPVWAVSSAFGRITAPLLAPLLLVLGARAGPATNDGSH